MNYLNIKFSEFCMSRLFLTIFLLLFLPNLYAVIFRFQGIKFDRNYKSGKITILKGAKRNKNGQILNKMKRDRNFSKFVNSLASRRFEIDPPSRQSYLSSIKTQIYKDDLFALLAATKEVNSASYEQICEQLMDNEERFISKQINTRSTTNWECPTCFSEFINYGLLAKHVILSFCEIQLSLSE